MTSSPTKQIAREFYAQTYDASVPDWPGEIDFYRDLAAEATRSGRKVLEIACGTGRVATRLAQAGAAVVGLDLSQEMLAIARQKSVRTGDIRWVEADMRSFDLGETFGLALIPGNAFQNLNASQDQAACLDCIQRHLEPGGKLVVHLDPPDIPWLASLCGEKGGVFEPAGQFRHPGTGRLVRTLQAWTYEPWTQTAIERTVWEELDETGEVIQRVEMGPVRLHCLYRFEMEHLLARTGFEVEALFGNFFRQEFTGKSSDMIWVARRRI